jgi:hypothetical protein
VVEARIKTQFVRHIGALLGAAGDANDATAR